MAALMIRFLAAFQFFKAIEDIIYMQAKHATDTTFSLYHFYAIMIGSRILLGLGLFALAVPLGRKLARGLVVGGTIPPAEAGSKPAAS